MKQLLKFSLEECLSNSIKKNAKTLKLFFLLFAVNIIIYGQKLFFTVLAPDDYYWFFEENIRESASWLGRWMETLFNQNIFTSQYLHILPYIHGILGVFIVTLSAFLTGKILNIKKTYELIIITLLISATPYFAHLLYFNLILSAWLGILLSIIGLYYLYKPSKFLKLCGFIFIVMAIGTYQAILQVTIAIIMIKTVLELINTKETKEVLHVAFFSFLVVLVLVGAFLTSNFINHLYLEYHHLTLTGNFAKAGNIVDLSIYIDRIAQMYQFIPKFQYFGDLYSTLFYVLLLISALGVFFIISVSQKSIKSKLISLLFVVILFIAIPLVINLPLITGTYLPIRSQFTIGWFTVGAFILMHYSFRGIIRSFSEVVIWFLIATNIYYINVFYYAAQRQTQADIINANQIVTQIRLDQNYSSEPMEFYIVGVKKFSVEGWTTNLQAFGTNWSHYWIFKHFTNFQFHIMDDNEYKKMEQYLVDRDEPLHSYPGKNSIIVYKGKAVLFLDASKINQKIQFKNILKKTPDINATFNLTMDNGTIYYTKSPCSKEDTKKTFFLHVYPNQIEKIPPAQQIYGFQNLDFKFNSFGIIENNQCIATRELPAYDIKFIKTGQFHDNIVDWDVEYNFEENK